ncbi:MAG: hypothetical protein EOM07_04430 [Clostridia bacterium]|nr:hypothetical protein [Clostridia bacterium]
MTNKLKGLDQVQYLLVVLLSYLLTFGLLGSLGVRDYLISTYSRLVDFVVFLLIYLAVFLLLAYVVDWLWKVLKIRKK